MNKLIDESRSVFGHFPECVDKPSASAGLGADGSSNSNTGGGVSSYLPSAISAKGRTGFPPGWVETAGPLLEAAAARSPEMDFRIAVHECGHVLVHRIFGDDVSGVTIAADDFSEGRTWGPYAVSAAASTTLWDAETAPANLHQPGRALDGDVDGVFASVQRGVIALMGGAASEMAFLGDRPPMFASNDVPQASEVAEMVCRTRASVAAFVEHAYQEALAIIEHPRNKPIVHALARALIEHPAQTLNAVEIDQCILDTVDRESREAEIKRRADWHLVETGAATFTAAGLEN